MDTLSCRQASPRKRSLTSIIGTGPESNPSRIHAIRYTIYVYYQMKQMIGGGEILPVCMVWHPSLHLLFDDSASGPVAVQMSRLDDQRLLVS
jgi:hypothetical protein